MKTNSRNTVITLPLMLANVGFAQWQRDDQRDLGPDVRRVFVRQQFNPCFHLFSRASASATT